MTGIFNLAITGGSSTCIGSWPVLVRMFTAACLGFNFNSLKKFNRLGEFFTSVLQSIKFQPIIGSFINEVCSSKKT
jgi:hypothetical protein